jgi:glycosyltransferase involved in cell wall biosynthesis
MTQELVSIVIPAYFADQFLAETLTGISRQTYQFWEVILVEDGSVTETERIVSEFLRSHPNHRVVYDRFEANRGQSAARNRAIALSEGNYIALLDADDVWLPEHLSSSLKLLADREIELSFSTSIMFDDETQKLTGFWGPKDEELEKLALSLIRRAYITPSSVVMKKSVIEKVGQFDEDRNLQGAEDYDFWLRSIISGVKFAHLYGAFCLS